MNKDYILAIIVASMYVIAILLAILCMIGVFGYE